MRSKIIYILIIVSMIATPVAAVTSRQPACLEPHCCCQTVDADHASRASMGHAACGCQSTPLDPCHIETIPYMPLPALAGSTDRGEYPKRIFLSTAIDVEARVMLPTALTTPPWRLEFNPTRPPTYLADCVWII